MAHAGPPIIVGFSGNAGSGKDEAARALVVGRDFEKRAFADPLRKLARAADPYVTNRRLNAIWRYEDAELSMGYESAKKSLPEFRMFLQRLGQGARQVFGEDFWINQCLDATRPRVVVPDVRYKNEAQAILDRGGLLVRITRPGVEPANDHIAEHDLDEWSFDHHIINNGTIDELHLKVLECVDIAFTYHWPEKADSYRSEGVG